MKRIDPTKIFMMISNRKKTLWYPWFIQKYFRVVRVRRNCIHMERPSARTAPKNTFVGCRVAGSLFTRTDHWHSCRPTQVLYLLKYNQEQVSPGNYETLTRTVLEVGLMSAKFAHHYSTCMAPGITNINLPLYKVADTPFHIQWDDVMWCVTRLSPVVCEIYGKRMNFDSTLELTLL